MSPLFSAQPTTEVPIPCTAHHWLLPEPNGRTGISTCKLCGITKEHFNSHPLDWGKGEAKTAWGKKWTPYAGEASPAFAKPRRLTRQPKERKAWEHGSHSGYKVYECRCDLCTEAHLSYQRERREKRREYLRAYRAEWRAKRRGAA